MMVHAAPLDLPFSLSFSITPDLIRDLFSFWRSCVKRGMTIKIRIVSRRDK